MGNFAALERKTDPIAADIPPENSEESKIANPSAVQSGSSHRSKWWRWSRWTAGG
jgi:hypothetical protein